MQTSINRKDLIITQKLEIIVLLALVMVYSCGDFRLDDWERLEEMQVDILALVGEANCSDSTQCRYIALRPKPCGGPWEFLVYCSSEVDSVRLVELVNEYNQFEEELNNKYGRTSDCSVPPEPQLGYIGGHCVDLREPYHYQAYDTLGTLIVSGWFKIEFHDSTAIQGSWVFDSVGEPENIGPQTGNGHFIGYQNTAEIRLELNPYMMDNNVSLYGTFNGTVINGEWQFTGYPGLLNEGSFYAEK